MGDPLPLDLPAALHATPALRLPHPSLMLLLPYNRVDACHPLTRVILGTAQALPFPLLLWLHPEGAILLVQQPGLPLQHPGAVPPLSKGAPALGERQEIARALTIVLRCLDLAWVVGADGLTAGHPPPLLHWTRPRPWQRLPRAFVVCVCAAWQWSGRSRSMVRVG